MWRLLLAARSPFLICGVPLPACTKSAASNLEGWPSEIKDERHVQRRDFRAGGFRQAASSFGHRNSVRLGVADLQDLASATQPALLDALPHFLGSRRGGAGSPAAGLGG